MGRRFGKNNIEENVKVNVRRNKALEVVKVELTHKQEIEQQIRFLLRELRKTKSMEERINIRNKIWKLESELRSQGVA